MLFSTKVPCPVASVALLCKLPQFYTNLENLLFAMNKKNGIGESKPKQSRRQGESALEMPVGCTYAVESLAVGKVLTVLMPGAFKNPCRIVPCSAIALRLFICEKCRSTWSRCSFFFVYAGGLRLFEKRKVITRGNSDITRDELHLEPSALWIDDRDQTSRHSSPQYANSAIALRGAKSVKIKSLCMRTHVNSDNLYNVPKT